MVNTRSQEQAIQREEPVNTSDVLLQILDALRGLAQSNADTRSAILEAVTRPIPPTVPGGNGASSSAGGAGPAQEARGAGVPPVVLNESVPVRREGHRVVMEEDRFTVEKFNKNGAKVFVGGTDPLQAENWINVTQTAFRAMQVPHRHQTRLATCMLQEEAYQWWKTTEETTFKGRDINSLSWAEFVEEFNRQYFPEPVIQQKALEFSTLTQGDDSVREYDRKFLALERFSPGSLTNEKGRANKFFWGLKFELRDRIANIPRTNLVDVINAAANHELILEQERAHKKSFPPKSVNQNQSTNKPSGQQQQWQMQGQNKRKRDDERRPANCRNCGKTHQGRCLEPARCFNCGRTGHIARDCRSPTQNRQ